VPAGHDKSGRDSELPMGRLTSRAERELAEAGMAMLRELADDGRTKVKAKAGAQ
jgi:hypothetical protein